MVEIKTAETIRNKIPFRHMHKISELARWKGVTPGTVRRWCMLGLVEHVHDLGLITIPHEEFVRVIIHGISYPDSKPSGNDRLR